MSGAFWFQISQDPLITYPKSMSVGGTWLSKEGDGLTGLVWCGFLWSGVDFGGLVWTLGFWSAKGTELWL